MHQSYQGCHRLWGPDKATKPDRSASFRATTLAGLARRDLGRGSDTGACGLCEHESRSNEGGPEWLLMHRLGNS